MQQFKQSRSSYGMPQKRVVQGMAYWAAAGLLALSGSLASAQSGLGTTGIDATGDAKSELAACKNGASQQDSATCMKEVRNAQAAKRAGKLETNTDYAANALKRCEAFKDASEQSACQARIMNTAGATGSVAAGGVLRQAEVLVPAQ